VKTIYFFISHPKRAQKKQLVHILLKIKEKRNQTKSDFLFNKDSYRFGQRISQALMDIKELFTAETQEQNSKKAILNN